MKIIRKLIRIKPDGLQGVEISHEYCCSTMQYALDHNFLNQEWEDSKRLTLDYNPDLDLVGYSGYPDREELQVNFCPFCGRGIEWVEVL